MARINTASIAFMIILLSACTAAAHFGMIIPDKNLVGAKDDKVVVLEYRFWHPMENIGMDLAKPAKTGVVLGGKDIDLGKELTQEKVAGKVVWRAQQRIKKPGDYLFYMEPQPYWEPAEDCFIIHNTKTVVSALGAEEGWDKPVGQKMEILPLTRPYGVWAGNSFTGKVLFKGKPLADCDVEIEFYNPKGEVIAPAENYVTQLVRTDANGVFNYTMPWAGWWGFAALHTDDEKMKKDGVDKEVEIGGVLWVYAHPHTGR